MDGDSSLCSSLWTKYKISIFSMGPKSREEWREGGWRSDVVREEIPCIVRSTRERTPSIANKASLGHSQSGNRRKAQWSMAGNVGDEPHQIPLGKSMDAITPVLPPSGECVVWLGVSKGRPDDYAQNHVSSSAVRAGQQHSAPSGAGWGACWAGHGRES